MMDQATAWFRHDRAMKHHEVTPGFEFDITSITIHPEVISKDYSDGNFHSRKYKKENMWRHF